MAINSWSFSRLDNFEKCAHRAFLLYDQKIPEPQRPLPPGKSEHANDRGTRIHDGAEHFVRGTGKFLDEMSSFRVEFDAMARLYKEGRVSLEGEWAMDKQWEPTEWAKGWLRLKLDALVFLSDTEAVAIDYKTGRKFGNEIKHAEQLQLYQLNTFLRYPQLETVHTELWYLDQDDITSMTYQRHQGLRFRQRWDMRGNKLTNATSFPPNPNIFSCKWCMYGAKGSGVCERGL